MKFWDLPEALLLMFAFETLSMREVVYLALTCKAGMRVLLTHSKDIVMFQSKACILSLIYHRKWEVAQKAYLAQKGRLVKWKSRHDRFSNKKTVAIEEAILGELLWMTTFDPCHSKLALLSAILPNLPAPTGYRYLPPRLPVEMAKRISCYPNVRFGFAPFVQWAAHHGHVEVFSNIIDRAEIGRKRHDWVMKTLVQMHQPKVLKRYIEHPKGCIVDDGYKYLCAAIRISNLTSFETMLKYGNIMLWLGNNAAIIAAVESGSELFVDLLLNHKMFKFAPDGQDEVVVSAARLQEPNILKKILCYCDDPSHYQANLVEAERVCHAWCGNGCLPNPTANNNAAMRTAVGYKRRGCVALLKADPRVSAEENWATLANIHCKIKALE